MDSKEAWNNTERAKAEQLAREARKDVLAFEKRQEKIDARITDIRSTIDTEVLQTSIRGEAYVQVPIPSYLPREGTVAFDAEEWKDAHDIDEVSAELVSEGLERDGFKVTFSGRSLETDEEDFETWERIYHVSWYEGGGNSIPKHRTFASAILSFLKG